MDRTCKTCGITNPERGFYSEYAKECRKCRDKRRVEQNRERYRRDLAFRASMAERNRGRTNAASGVAGQISVKAYREKLLVEQLGLCAICAGSVPLSIDHDHNSCHPGSQYCVNCIRGLLCSNCNSGLGMFRDNPTFLQAAVDYLAKHAASGEAVPTK